MLLKTIQIHNHPVLDFLSFNFRSIDSDHVVKGRRFDPRKPRFTRQQAADNEPKHEERPKGADRGKRNQSIKESDGKLVLTLRKHAYSNILKMSPSKNENFQIKNSDIFHTSSQNIDCGYSLEPPRRGGSNEYPQSMF